MDRIPGLEYRALRGTFAPVHPLDPPCSVATEHAAHAWPARVFAVVPARDEAAHIAAVIRAMPARVERIVVVDDGSSDDTSAVVRALGEPRVQLLRHDVSRGVGAAIARGYAHAFGHGADVAVVMAGDGQMDPNDLPRLLAAVGTEARAVYVKGTRLRSASVLFDMPRARLVGNLALTLMTRIATCLSVTDAQCGFTVLSRQAAARLDLTDLWPRYGYPNDLLARCAARGVPVVEVPVRAVYAGEKSGIRLRDALFVVPYVIASSVRRQRRGG